MKIPANRWYQVIANRRSRRQLDASRPVGEMVLKDLKSFCDDFRPFSNSRAVLMTENAEEVFKGIIGAYGKVKDAPAAIAFIGDMGDDHVQEKTGYMVKALSLKLQLWGWQLAG